jgi:nucleoside 2-deoxyribosyltransferase
LDHYRVYLSGPIWGRSYSEATEWRNEVYEVLSDYAEVLDPMRDRHLAPGASEDEPILTALVSEDMTLATDRGIVARDYYDTITSNLLIINLLGAERVSTGTVSEMAWAYHLRIPMIVIVEPTGNPHDHAFIREMTSYRVDSIDRAIRVAKSLMGVPEVEPFVWPALS